MEKLSHPFDVGQRIKSIRKELGLSMEAFAKSIDKNAKSGTVNNWETGKNLPNKSRLEKIAELGGVSVEYLLYGNIYDFLNINLAKYIKNYFIFIQDIFPNDIFHVVVSVIEKENIQLTDSAKIEDLMAGATVDMLDEFDSTFDERMEFILKHKHLKEMVLKDLSTRYKYFNETAQMQVEEIFDNCVTAENTKFMIVFKEVYNSLNYILNNAPRFINISALNIDEKLFLTRDYFYCSLEATPMYIKNKIYTYSPTIARHYLLVELENGISKDVKAGDILLVENFPEMEKGFFSEHYVDSKIVVIHNQKIHIGSLNSNHIFKSEEMELNINELETYNSIFPVQAIFY